MAINGIDVSHHQSISVYAKAIKDAAFCICKATEGKSWVDEKFTLYMQDAIGKGKLIGAYHFARPDNNNPEEEAQHFLAIVKPYLGTCILALDWEGAALQYDLSWAKTWLDYVYKKTGVRPLFYASASVLSKAKEIANADYGLWVAHYGVSSPSIYPWMQQAIWQYEGGTDQSKPWDKDIFYGGADQWQKYCTPEFIELPDEVDNVGECLHWKERAIAAEAKLEEIKQLVQY